MTINIEELSEEDIGRPVNYSVPDKIKPDGGVIRSYDEYYIYVAFPSFITNQIAEDNHGIGIHPDELEFINQ